MQFKSYALMAALAFVSTLADAESAPKQSQAKNTVSSPALREVVMKAELIDGKTHWTPARVEVVQGEHFSLKMEHDIKEGFAFHGVEIAELGIRHQVNRSQHVTLDAKVPTDLKVGEYPIRCQFHPGHVGAVLVVKAAATNSKTK